jgi:hypothetical protein
VKRQLAPVSLESVARRWYESILGERQLALA